MNFIGKKVFRTSEKSNSSNKMNETMNETINKTTTSSRRRIHNLIIVDESGSMQAIYKSALLGLNNTLKTIRSAQEENPDQMHLVHMCTFNTGGINVVYQMTSAENTCTIQPEQYRPCGGTPLYDAMGMAINRLRSAVEKDDVVLVTIITDGYENASREYSGAAIKSLVDEMKNNDWVFTYIGANQNVEEVAKSMSIDNHLEFSCDQEGVDVMFDKEAKARKCFYARVSSNMPGNSIKDNYFDA